MNAMQTLTMQNVLPEVLGVSCEHRTVSKDGRIVCRKIATGDNEVSPNICRTCPFKAVRCEHLRFSLRKTEPCRLIVRFNGRTEIWDDEPPDVRFEQAACAAKVLPIQHPKQCVGCALRQPVAVGSGAVPAGPPRRSVASHGAVAFSGRVAAPTG